MSDWIARKWQRHKRLDVALEIHNMKPDARAEARQFMFHNFGSEAVGQLDALLKRISETTPTKIPLYDSEGEFVAQVEVNPFERESPGFKHRGRYYFYNQYVDQYREVTVIDCDGRD